MSFDDILYPNKTKEPEIKSNLITKGCFNCEDSVLAEYQKDEYWCYRYAKIQGGKMWCIRWQKE